MGHLYEELLLRNPKDTRILLALARMHIKRADYSEALRAVNEALEIEPASLPARLLAVEIHRRRGDSDRALSEVEDLLRGLGTADPIACAKCGERLHEFWSRCPSCLAWIAAA
jgi:Flp pilus assembly protein TadD